MPLPLLGSVAAGHQTIRFLFSVNKPFKKETILGLMSVEGRPGKKVETGNQAASEKSANSDGAVIENVLSISQALFKNLYIKRI
jgi:hypothetical protein